MVARVLLLVLVLIVIVPVVHADTVRITADDAFVLYVNGVSVGSGGNWTIAFSFDVTLNPGYNVVAVQAWNGTMPGTPVGLLAEIDVDGDPQIVTDTSWLVSADGPAGWETLSFDDSAWPNADDLGPVGTWTPGGVIPGSSARWIWKIDELVPCGASFCETGTGIETSVFFRRVFWKGQTVPVEATTWGKIKGLFQ